LIHLQFFSFFQTFFAESSSSKRPGVNVIKLFTTVS
jgi:hypothetical protein